MQTNSISHLSEPNPEIPFAQQAAVCSCRTEHQLFLSASAHSRQPKHLPSFSLIIVMIANQPSVTLAASLFVKLIFFFS